MRHGKKNNHLGRTREHRIAMLNNMASSLIIHKRISTTLAKAKALRKFVEPLITKAKDNTTHSRRTVFSYLHDKEAVKELFGDVAVKVADRPGGYTRIFKTGNRLGDNAETAIIELVDYNELMLAAKGEKAKGKTRRSRRGKGTSGAVAATKTAPITEAKVEDVKAEEVATEETVVADAVAEVTNEVENTPVAETPAEDANSAETTTEEETK